MFYSFIFMKSGLLYLSFTTDYQRSIAVECPSEVSTVALRSTETAIHNRHIFRKRKWHTRAKQHQRQQNGKQAFCVFHHNSS